MAALIPNALSYVSAIIFGLSTFGGIPVRGAPPTFVNLDEVEQPESLADGFKVSLVRPPDEPANSGSKMLVNVSSVHLFEESEIEVLDAYDALFEKYSLFCNGRWLGAQILQDSQDLMYLQHITYMKKPDAIIETGTYKGGLTYFFASLLDWIDAQAGRADHTVSGSRDGAQIISVDAHHPDLIFAANWFCPVCIDCIRPYTTDVWQRRVRFVQGHADSGDVYNQILNHLYDIGVMQVVDQASGEVVASADLQDGRASSAVSLAVDPEKTVVVNLDANHEFEGLFKELLFYAPLVSKGSYLVVQDTKLDKIWGTSGPTAALNRFLSLAPEGEYVLEPELKFHAYSQHTYLRRVQVTVPHTYFLEKVQAITESART